VILTKKYYQNHWFYNICEKKVTVVAAALVERPSRCSHSNFIFANVVKPIVLTTFFVALEARYVAGKLLAL